MRNETANTGSINHLIHTKYALESYQLN
jgi:hypothetical protein